MVQEVELLEVVRAKDPHLESLGYWALPPAARPTPTGELTYRKLRIKGFRLVMHVSLSNTLFATLLL
jgi:hypothetical protein